MMDFSKSYAMLDVPGAYEHDVYDFDGLVAAWRSQFQEIVEQRKKIEELEDENDKFREENTQLRNILELRQAHGRNL